jgi:hypothetical protein
MGERFSQIVLPQVGMGIDMNEMEVGVNTKHLFHHGEANQMVAAQEDRKFPGGKDLAKAVLNQTKRHLLIAQRHVQITHIVDT